MIEWVLIERTPKRLNRSSFGNFFQFLVDPFANWKTHVINSWKKGQLSSEKSIAFKEAVQLLMRPLIKYLTFWTNNNFLIK